MTNINKYGLDLQIGNIWYQSFWENILFYAILTIIGCLLLVFIYYFLIKFKTKRAISKSNLIITYLQSYHKQIDLVSSQVFYFTLIDNLKKFIDYQYNFEIAKQTDLEIKKFLKNKNQDIDHHLKEILIYLLDFSCTARFAKAVVNQEQMEIDLQKVINIMQQVVNKTKPNE